MDNRAFYTTIFVITALAVAERAMLCTAREHLQAGGMFFFDFWHGSGVLRELPERREKTLEDEKTRITRVAEPAHRIDDHIVKVHYTVTLADKASGELSQIMECHPMRYWFFPELRKLADQAGFSFVAGGGWMHRASASEKDWNAWMLLRA